MGRALAVLLTSLLMSCNDPQPSLQIIGNSLTLHLAAPSLGWYGNWGMAASAQDKDFAHLTATAMGLPVEVHNLAALEITGDTSQIAAATAHVTPYSAVIVQLGDDTPSTQAAAFQPLYRELLDNVASASQLVCLSTWWGNTVVDAVIEQECYAHAGVYVYIGDIYPVRQDDVGRYANSGVDKHPHDWSMAVIASRVVAALSE